MSAQPGSSGQDPAPVPRPAFPALAAVSVALLAWALACAPALAQEWVATWGTGLMAAPSYQDFGLRAQTVRMMIRASAGGRELRIRLSNAHGTAPLRIGAARVGLRAQGADVVPGSDRLLRFGGATEVRIEPGATARSDPVALRIEPGTELAISLYVADAAPSPTLHEFALGAAWIAAGDATAAVPFPAGKKVDHWYFLAEVEVRDGGKSESAAATTTTGTDADTGKSPMRSAIVVFGDSIADGYGSTPEANRRWPDLLARRLVARGGPRGVVNKGISGNALLREIVGPSGLARFGRDVLEVAGAGSVIVALGANDIGQSGSGPAAVTLEALLEGHRQLVARAHARGLRVYGATVVPFGGSAYNPSNSTDDPRERLRQEFNRALRAGGLSDGCIDFDAAIRDPARPQQIRREYDSGDHLHPGDAGYARMAEAVDLGLFAAPPVSDRGQVLR